MTHDRFPNNSPQPDIPSPQHAAENVVQDIAPMTPPVSEVQFASAGLPFEFDFERAEAADVDSSEFDFERAEAADVDSSEFDFERVEAADVDSSLVEIGSVEFDFERAEAADLNSGEIDSLNEIDLNEIDDREIIYNPDNLDKLINLKAYRANAEVDPEELELNAYLDGELTDAVRQRVEMLLHADASHRQRYNQLARLSREFKRLPVPPSSVTAEELADRAIAVAQERRRRSFTWGTSAVAALFLAVLSSTGSLRSNFYAPNVAQTPTPRFYAEELQAQPNTAPRVSQNVADRAVNSPTNNHSPLVSRALFVE